MEPIFRIIDKNDVSGKIRYSSIDSLYDEIESIVGEKLCSNGIPVSIEVQGWGELAYVGEIFETEDIVVELVED